MDTLLQADADEHSFFTPAGTPSAALAAAALTCCPSPAHPPACAGMPTGLFVGDCGFTCCWLDGVLDQLAVGTDRGIVHALDLGVAPRGMAGAPLASPALAAAQGGHHHSAAALTHNHASASGSGAAHHVPAGAGVHALPQHGGPHQRLPATWLSGMPPPQQLPGGGAAVAAQQGQRPPAPQPHHHQQPPPQHHHQQQQQRQQQPLQPADAAAMDAEAALAAQAAKLTVGAS